MLSHSSPLHPGVRPGRCARRRAAGPPVRARRRRRARLPAHRPRQGEGRAAALRRRAVPCSLPRGALPRAAPARNRAAPGAALRSYPRRCLTQTFHRGSHSRPRRCLDWPVSRPTVRANSLPFAPLAQAWGLLASGNDGLAHIGLYAGLVGSGCEPARAPRGAAPAAATAATLLPASQHRCPSRRQRPCPVRASVSMGRASVGLAGPIAWAGSSSLSHRVSRKPIC